MTGFQRRPVLDFRPPRPGSHLDKGLRYLRRFKGGTIVDMAREMNCEEKYVAQFLQRAIDAGLVGRGYFWIEEPDE